MTDFTVVWQSSDHDPKLRSKALSNAYREILSWPLNNNADSVAIPSRLFTESAGAQLSEENVQLECITENLSGGCHD
jgi:hypothetical protein